MIWALLEITLPLCIAFLFGLLAGWMCWRWRRRLVSANDLSQGNNAEIELLKTQCQETSADRDAIHTQNQSLQNTVNQQKVELAAMDKSAKALSRQLQHANKASGAASDAIAVVYDPASNAAATEAQLQKLKTETAKNENLTRQNNELQQKLKQAETVADERDTAISKMRGLEQKLAKSTQAEAGLAQAKNELEHLEQQLNALQTNVAGEKDSTDGENERLRRRIQQLEEANKDHQGQMRELSELQLKCTEQQQHLEKTNTEKEQASASLAEKTQVIGRLRQRINALQTQPTSLANTSNDNDAAQEKIGKLEQQLLQANTTATELKQSKATIANLTSQLNTALTKTAELSEQTAPTDKEQLTRNTQELAQLKTDLPKSRQELRTLQRQFAEVTAQLNQERTAHRKLKNTQQSTSAERNSTTKITSINVGQVKKLKAEITEKDAVIAKLKKKKAIPASRTSKNSWQQGETKIGTPGCDHKDDLTVINGIGPKIEKVLNKLGIKSWEQLATLKVAEIKKVDEALVDFSGRIQRDEWVAQAKAIMRNNHQPINKAPAQKPKGRTAAKNAWHKGQTKFGTPGSAHKDDLQVISGIGPVIEKALNARGIKSWEQLASLKVSEVKMIDEALDFPGRIDREQWVAQAKALVKQYPDITRRRVSKTELKKVAAR